MFKVISKFNEPITNSFNSIHLMQRNPRLSAYKGLMSNTFIDKFIVDTNHKNGLEVHAINEYGLIYIYNRHLMRLITILHPRPAQIKRYYKQLGLTVNRDMKAIIRKNERRIIDRKLNEV